MSTTAPAPVKGLAPAGSAADSRIMIVLDSPTYADLSDGVHLTGSLGVSFDTLLARAGLSRDNVLITYAINQSLPNGTANWMYDKKGKLTSAFSMVYMTNMLRLMREIKEADPNVIIAMGDIPLQILAGKGHWVNRKEKDKKTGESEVIGWTGISDWRGSIIEGIDVFKGRKILAMQDVEPITKQWKLHMFWLADMARAIEQAKFPEIRRHPRRLLIDPPKAEWDSLAEQLLSSPDPISFDIEHYNGKLLCIGFCAYSGWALTISNTGPEAVEFYRRVLESGHPLCAQNASFDCSVLEWHEGIRTLPHLTYDTILAAHAAYIELPKDLGTLCSIYTEEPCYWDKSDWSGLGKSWTFAEMLEYNCKDSWVTHEIRREQLANDLVDPVIRATFEFEMNLLNPLWDISRRGILWSQEQLAAVQRDAVAGLAKAQHLLNVIHPHLEGGLNVGSAPQVAALLYDHLKVPAHFGMFRGTTRSTNDLVLGSIATHPNHKDKPEAITVRLIREARKHKSMMSKFSGNGADKVGIKLDSDGRFRSTYVPSATDTGRLSAKKFFPTGNGANAQNQPRVKPVRRCFIPDKGKIIGYNDLERAESFVVAKITGDPVMLEHHLPGRNAHRLLGKTLFDKAPEEIDEHEYYLCKKTRHAGNYMQGWMTFMTNVNKEADSTGLIIDAKTAKRLIGTYKEMHTGLSRWWRAVEYEVKHTRTLHNLFGRRRVFYGRIANELPAAVAYIPQSTVGDCMNYAILNLWRAGIVGQPDSPIEMLAQIHDALVYQFEDRSEQENLALLRRVRQHMLIDIRNPLDGETFVINTMPAISSVSWGDCKELSAAELGLV